MLGTRCGTSDFPNTELDYGRAEGFFARQAKPCGAQTF